MNGTGRRKLGSRCVVRSCRGLSEGSSRQTVARIESIATIPSLLDNFHVLPLDVIGECNLDTTDPTSTLKGRKRDRSNMQ